MDKFLGPRMQFLNWDACRDEPVKSWNLMCISFNANKIGVSNAAAVFGDPGDLLPTPLNSEL